MAETGTTIPTPTPNGHVHPVESRAIPPLRPRGQILPGQEEIPAAGAFHLDRFNGPGRQLSELGKELHPQKTYSDDFLPRAPRQLGFRSAKEVP